MDSYEISYLEFLVTSDKSSALYKDLLASVLISHHYWSLYMKSVVLCVRCELKLKIN
jgi:hypothetical protein